MRTGYVVSARTKPGRAEDALAQAHESIKLFERLGADEVAYRYGGAGTVNGTTTFRFEAASPAAMGELLDRMLSDSEYVGFITRLNAADAPAELGQITSYNVLDLGLPVGTPGRVGTMVFWQPARGRAEEALALAADAAKALVRLGASRCRVVQITTGEIIPLFVSVTESASFTDQGRWRGAIDTDEEWRSIGARLASADAPGTYQRFAEWYTPI